LRDDMPGAFSDGPAPAGSPDGRGVTCLSGPTAVECLTRPRNEACSLAPPGDSMEKVLMTGNAWVTFEPLLHAEPRKITGGGS
jgi:hypothetical protein